MLPVFSLAVITVERRAGELADPLQTQKLIDAQLLL
jgi:hypothetical protein